MGTWGDEENRRHGRPEERQVVRHSLASVDPREFRLQGEHQQERKKDLHARESGTNTLHERSKLIVDIVVISLV
jgi:hypothetical protein